MNFKSEALVSHDNFSIIKHFKNVNLNKNAYTHFIWKREVAK